MDYKDYYKIMGVERDAKQDDIKRAYRKLARKYHPDVSNEKDAETKFKEVGEANEVLKDPEKELLMISSALIGKPVKTSIRLQIGTKVLNIVAVEIHKQIMQRLVIFSRHYLVKILVLRKVGKDKVVIREVFKNVVKITMPKY